MSLMRVQLWARDNACGQPCSMHMYCTVLLALEQAAFLKRRYEEHSSRSSRRRAAGDGTASESPPPQTSARSRAPRTPAAPPN